MKPSCMNSCNAISVSALSVACVTLGQWRCQIQVCGHCLVVRVFVACVTLGRLDHQAMDADWDLEMELLTMPATAD